MAREIAGLGGRDNIQEAESELDRQLDELVASVYPISPPAADEPPRAPNESRPATNVPATIRSADGRPDPNARLVSIDRLRTDVYHSLSSGMTLAYDIYDETGVLLLAAGSRVTARFLQLLRERNITRVRLRSAAGWDADDADEEIEATVSADGLHTGQSRHLDQRMAGELQRPVFLRPTKGWRRPRMTIEVLKYEAEQGVKTHKMTAAAVTELCQRLLVGRKVPLTDLQRSVDHFVSIAAVDYDLLPLIVALQQTRDDYLYDHCVNVAMMSVAMAYQLGLDRQAIADIGLSAMLHDIGMLRVPEGIRFAPRALTEEEWAEVYRHPLHTLDMLAGLRSIPLAVKFVAYQVHERIDGGGYPRGRTERQLHRYAEIVAIADVYAAMTRGRPYREAVMPYLAVRQLLLDGRANRYDRALIRGFLDTISLFPIGSQVTLSNGQKARILRANPGLHTRPVVEETTDDGCPTGQIIDLSAGDAPYVVQANR